MLYTTINTECQMQKVAYSEEQLRHIAELRQQLSSSRQALQPAIEAAGDYMQKHPHRLGAIARLLRRYGAKAKDTLYGANELIHKLNTGTDIAAAPVKGVATVVTAPIKGISKLVSLGRK